MSIVDPAYRQTLDRLHRELDITPDYATLRGLVAHGEAAGADLVEIAITDDGRSVQLTIPATAAWRRMRQAAQRDGIELVPISGFRSVARQADIIRRHLATGRSLDDLLASVAAPGFSEHHTGRALDLGSPGCTDLSETFGGTPAFVWLMVHAADHGFQLSYPRGNSHGIVYEPWHWCWRMDGRGQTTLRTTTT